MRYCGGGVPALRIARSAGDGKVRLIDRPEGSILDMTSHDISHYQSLVNAEAACDDAAAGCPFHLPSLLDRCLSDRHFCAVLVQKFIDRANELAAQMEQAAQAGDAGQLALHAHGLKGLAANMSADNLQFWAATLERTARRANPVQLRPLVSRVRREIETCVAAVPRLLEQIAAAR
jgi:HPt (histidine-containing phosphotransfer) domain-containing protein